MSDRFFNTHTVYADGVYYEPFLSEDGRVGYRCVSSGDFTCLVCGAPVDEEHGPSEDPETGELAVTCDDTQRDGADNQRETFVYLNPSTSDGDPDFTPNVFVYIGGDNDPALDTPQHFYDIDFEDESGAGGDQPLDPRSYDKVELDLDDVEAEMMMALIGRELGRADSIAREAMGRLRDRLTNAKIQRDVRRMRLGQQKQ